MTEVFRSPAARRDLVEHYAYLYDNASEAVADRFLRRAESSFADLARQPMMGAPLTLKHPALVNLRKWRVKDFDNHPIPQRALNHQSPIQALKRWQIDKPELFVKRVYKQAGLDK